MQLLNKVDIIMLIVLKCIIDGGTMELLITIEKWNFGVK